MRLVQYEGVVARERAYLVEEWVELGYGSLGDRPDEALWDTYVSIRSLMSVGRTH